MKTASWLLLLFALVSCKRLTSGAIDADTAPSASIYAIEMPRAQANGTESIAVMMIVIRADGAISYGGLDLKDENELADKAREALRQSPNVRAVINADQSVPFGRVITVLDTLKRSGVSRISFGTASIPRVEP